MHHRHHDAVVALMRRVAAEIVMPRFRNLAADEVEEKAADDTTVLDVFLSERHQDHQDRDQRRARAGTDEASRQACD